MKNLTLLIIALGITTMLMSQNRSVSNELVNSSGDSFKNETYQIDWSIGECITATYGTDEYTITQGFHQKSYVITVVPELNIDSDIIVYPNPASDLFTLYTGNFETFVGPFNVLTLTDINGKVLLKEEIKEKAKQISLSKYKNGIYFITVRQDKLIIKTLKIVKQ